MFNSTIQHPYVVIFKSSEKTKVMAQVFASSRQEAIKLVTPWGMPSHLIEKHYRARRNIIHRVYTTL